jgi:hypothetical protein
MHTRPPQYTESRPLTTTLLAFLVAVAGITSFPTPSAGDAGTVTPVGESTGSWMDRLRAAVANIMPTLDLADDGADAWVLLQRIHGVFLSRGWPPGLPSSQVAKLRADLDTAASLLGGPPEEVDPATACQAAAWIAEMRANLDEVYP